MATNPQQQQPSEPPPPPQRRDAPEFMIERTLHIGAEAGLLDASIVFKAFLRPDIEAEYRRWGWESTRIQNAVVAGLTTVGAAVYAGVTLNLAAQILHACGALFLFLATVRFAYVAWRLPNWTYAERCAHTKVQAVTALVATTTNIVLMSAAAIIIGQNCQLRDGNVGVADADKVCVRSVRSAEAFCFFVIHRLSRNPMVTAGVTAVIVLLFVFAASLSNADFSSTDVAARQAAFLLVNGLFVVAEVQADRVSRQQFRSMLQLEDARRLNEIHRDRLAYVVRRALPARFAARLSRTIAHGTVLPLSELYDSAGEATLCATAVTGFSQWSTKQLQESGVLALHRLFTLFDDGARVFGVDSGSAFGDTYYVTAKLIRGSTVRASRVMRFALWQLHVRFGATDELPGYTGTTRSGGPRSAIAGFNRAPGSMTADPACASLLPEAGPLPPDGDTGDTDLFGGRAEGAEPVANLTSFDDRSLSGQVSVNPKLHSTVITGPLAGGMTGSRELRYFLSGSALRRSNEVLPAVPAGCLWASESALHALVSNAGDESDKFTMEPASKVPPPSELTKDVRGFERFYDVRMPEIDSRTRRAAAAAGNTSGLARGGDAFFAEDADASAPGRYGDGIPDTPRAAPPPGPLQDEPDLADIAAAILEGEIRDRGSNPLHLTSPHDAELSVARTLKSTNRRHTNNETATLASYARTNIMSFVSRMSTAAGSQRPPTVDRCSGKLADDAAEKAFHYYSCRKAARGYPYVGVCFAAFFAATIAIAIPIRLTEGTFRGAEDVAAFVLCAIGGAVAAFTAARCHKHHKALRDARGRALKIAAQQAQAMQAAAADTGAGSQRSGGVSPAGTPACSPANEGLAGDHPSTSPRLEVATSKAPTPNQMDMEGTASPIDALEEEADNFDEFIFGEDPSAPSPHTEPWLSHRKISALSMLLLLAGFAVLALLRGSVITNTPLYFGLAIAPPIFEVVLSPLYRWQAVLFGMLVVGAPNVAIEFYHVGASPGPILASLYFLLIVCLFAATKPSHARHLFHVAHFAYVSRDATNRHSDMLGALLRRVVPNHVVKRGARAIDSERELIRDAAADALGQLRSAQLGDRVPRDPAVIDEFTDMAVVVVRLGPPDSHGVRFHTAHQPAGGSSSAEQRPDKPAEVLSSMRGSVTFSEMVHTRPQNLRALDAARDVMMRWGRIAQVISMVGGTSLEHVQSVGDGFVLAGPFDVRASFRAVQRSVFAGMTVLGCLACDLNLEFTAVCTVDEATGALVGRDALRYGLFGVSVRQCEELLNAVPPPPLGGARGHTPPSSWMPGVSRGTAHASESSESEAHHATLPAGMEFEPGFLVGRGSAAFCTRSFVCAIAPSVAHDWGLRETERRDEDERHRFAREDADAAADAKPTPRGHSVAVSRVDVAGFPSRDVFPHRPERWRARAVGIAYMWRLNFEAILEAGNVETLRELGFNPGESVGMGGDGMGNEGQYDDDDDNDDGDALEYSDATLASTAAPPEEYASRFGASRQPPHASHTAAARQPSNASSMSSGSVTGPPAVGPTVSRQAVAAAATRGRHDDEEYSIASAEQELSLPVIPPP